MDALLIYTPIILLLVFVITFGINIIEKKHQPSQNIFFISGVLVFALSLGGLYWLGATYNNSSLNIDCTDSFGVVCEMANKNSFLYEKYSWMDVYYLSSVFLVPVLLLLIGYKSAKKVNDNPEVKHP